MDSSRVELVPNGKYDQNRIEAIITKEQELSDLVARKRRKFTKKKSTSFTKRELTPLRKFEDGDDEDLEREDQGSSSEDEKSPKLSQTQQDPNQVRQELQRSTQPKPSGHQAFPSEAQRASNQDLPIKAPQRRRSTEPQSSPKHHQAFLFDEHKARPNGHQALPSETQQDYQEFKVKAPQRSTEAQPSPNRQKVRPSSLPIGHQEARSPTPTRSPEDFSSEPEHQPKTPVRRRFKQNHQQQQLTNGVSRNSSVSSRSDSFNRKKSLTDMAHDELLQLFNKTKRSIQRGRERFKRPKEIVKRSQSAPHQITEEDLVESFKRAQLLDDPAPKVFRPELVRERRKGRVREPSSKIVEVLDPKTLNVVSRKTFKLPHETFTIFQFLNSLRFLSPRDLLACYRSHKQTTRHQLHQIKLLWKQCLLELFLIMIICGIGGMIFKFTEGHFENFYKCGVKRVKRDFVDLLWIKSHNLREEDWKGLARTKLRVFEEELHAAHEAGMTSYSGQRSWSFLNGIVYSLSVITTIGYGHICPTTTTGRALTIVYSIIGIPLFLIALTDFGKLFTRGIKFIWSFVRRVYYTGNCRRYRKTAHVQEIFKGAQMMYDIATFRRPSTQIDLENQEQLPPPPPPTLGSTLQPPNTSTTGTLSNHDSTTTTPTTPNISNYEIDDEFNLPISVALFILVSYIFIGAVIYSAWEGWKFFISFYFVFISMSTIGFGDYVPKEPICMIVSIVYLVFGLALMSMCINVVQEKLSDTFKQASNKIGMSIGLEMSESGSVITADNIEVVPIHGISTNSMVTSTDRNVTPLDVDDDDDDDGVRKSAGSDARDDNDGSKKNL